MAKRYEHQPVSILLLAGCDAVKGAWLREALQPRGVDVMHCAGRSLSSAIQRLQPDAVVLSLDDSGVTVEGCREIYAGPILAVGGSSEEEAIAQQLDAGADDHVAAATGSIELAARICALLRRRDDPKEALQVGSLRVDLERHLVLNEDTELELTPYEFRVLELLARRSQRVVQHCDIVTYVWGKDFADAHSLAVLVGRLRRKLADVRSVSLETVIGVGYRLRESSPKVVAALPLTALAISSA